jgi:hypothetical protein
MIQVAFVLLILTFFLFSREGLAQNNMTLSIQSMNAALKDERMTEKQKIALQDAISYATHIKNIKNI